MKNATRYVVCQKCGFGSTDEDKFKVSPKLNSNKVDLADVKCPKCKERKLIERNY